jgi:1-acyl-sn-glycerol-3-phosphate acyltransferase
MLGFLPPVVRGVVSFLALALNTLFWCLLLFGLALVKAILRFDAARSQLDPLINGIASAWTRCNSAWMRLANRPVWTVQGAEDLRYNDWYLVNCNHQSWVDIIVLQDALNSRIPVLKFFLKSELIYVPVIGLAWWALDFPFMKRHSRAALRKNPNLRNDDRDSARRACAKFVRTPTSVMNFVEGTRFTAAKHEGQASPYKHLLKPKAGAMAMALNAMGAQFHSLIDASIAYPDGIPSFWQFLCGQSSRAVLKVRQVEIPIEFCTGDYENDRTLRRSFHRWLDEIWQYKDGELEAMLIAARTEPAEAA